MTARPVEARWALVGKRAGDRGDYSILSSGGPWAEDDRHQLDDLAELVWAAIPGTPVLGSIPGHGGLPWVTFVPSQDAHGRCWMTAAVMDTTKERDSAGRPNVAIRYVSLPFAEVAAGRTGYRTLYAAVPAADRLPDPPRPADLELPDDDATATDALVNPEIFDRAAGLAGLVLCGEVIVALADAPPLTVLERLSEFDCATALLPYGMRAEIALASWQDGTRVGRFRLSYGPFAGRGQTIVASGEAIPPPATEPARDYLRALRELRSRFGVVGLIDHLARHREPLAPGDIGQAAEILLSLGDPAVVVDAARVGRASAHLVANTRRYAGGRLSQDSHDVLETYLLAHEDSEEEALAVWSRRTATLAARLVLADIVTDGASPRARRLYALADQQGGAEEFLMALAERKASDGTLVQARSAAGLILGLTAPEAGELPRLRGSVLSQPVVGRWLLRRSLLGVGSGEWLQWLAWLNPADRSAPDWLRPYAKVTTSSAGSGRVRDGEEEDIALAARLAYNNEPAPQVTRAWWPFLFAIARRASSLPEFARADLEAIPEETDRPSVDLDTDVRLDTMLLYLDRPVRYFPFDGAAPQCARYLDALWDLWSGPQAYGDVAMLAARLLRSLLPAPDSTSETRPGRMSGEAIIALLLAVVRDSRIPLDDTLADIVAHTVTTTPGLLSDPQLTADWWTRMDRVRPGLRTPKVRFRTAVRRPDADPVEVAVLWAKAAAAVAEDREDLLVIALPWLTARAPAEVSAMLRILDGVLLLSGGGDDYLARIMSDLVAPRLAGTAGQAYADHELERIDKDVAFWRRMRAAILRNRADLSAIGQAGASLRRPRGSVPRQMLLPGYTYYQARQSPTIMVRGKLVRPAPMCRAGIVS